ncbi:MULTISPECIES: response regulator [unclassified Flavobacterium]|uniref:response regulator n=1 Tax=unclassified Flavobacterium TaxID=196869 RepID=UPI000EB3859E|nr:MULTISPECIES: response regulator [unclassified Flavobacterium]RKS01978.1 response regulator receiver domain-containing protein [Flavobacterium sp. 102]
MLEKILCVDDDAITLMLCKKVIERVAFANEVLTAKNGEEAIDYFNKLAPEYKLDVNVSYPKLIFLDLNMPIMNGWEFLDNYLQNDYQDVFKEAKFIVLSSTIDPQDVVKAKSYPMVIDFLSKPITKEMLEILKPGF